MANTVQRPRPDEPRMGYFRVETSTWQRLRALADSEQLTVSDIVRRAIREYLKRHKAA